MKEGSSIRRARKESCPVLCSLRLIFFFFFSDCRLSRETRIARQGEADQEIYNNNVYNVNQHKSTAEKVAMRETRLVRAGAKILVYLMATQCR